jgi:hypothetical protein
MQVWWRRSVHKECVDGVHLNGEVRGQIRQPGHSGVRLRGEVLSKQDDRWDGEDVVVPSTLNVVIELIQRLCCRNRLGGTTVEIVRVGVGQRLFC